MPSMYLTQIRKSILTSPPVEWGINQVRELLIGSLRQGPIPQHVAFVMDGNRRFARTHGIETVEGHNLGFEALARILEVCYKSGVKVVTIYAFSIENFKRSKYEVDALMDMAKVKLSQLSQHGDLLDRYGASIRILGQRELVKPDVLEAIDRAVDMTSRNGDAILNVCFPYTSRDEITTAIRNTVIEYSKPLEPAPRPLFSESHIAHNIRVRHLTSNSNTYLKPPRTHSPTSSATNSDTDTTDPPTQRPPSPKSHNNTPPDADHETASMSSSTTLHQSPPYVPSPTTEPTTTPPKSHSPSITRSSSQIMPIYPSPESITPATLTSHMFTAGTPPLDLLIRTSGVERLSDFMLWQCHQDTEIVFLDCLWPEFDLWNFLPVIWGWQWRKSWRAEGAHPSRRRKARGKSRRGKDRGTE